MEAPHTGIRRQFGQIMVEEGFVTQAQLDEAIAEQRRSGTPLGQALVELGLASAGAVANALAEQHGGLLKTEFGISAGLRPPVRPAAEEPERRRLVSELDALRDQCVALSRGVALLESELERLRDAV
ncbi:MAG TPA: hypothetical protein VML35_00950 [Gaiellaceae bacterium]|nr:hypothetical protein [Gaiellaceae bacterium]